MPITAEEVEKARDALSNVQDPELGMDIISLGLVYRLEPEGDDGLLLEMTLTTPGCPVSEILPQMAAEAAAEALAENDRKIDLRVVWDPPWSPEMIDPAALADLTGGG